MAALGGTALLAGTLGVVTGVPADPAVSSWSIVLLGVVYGVGGYARGRWFDLWAGCTTGGFGVWFLLALRWPPDRVDASTVAGYACLVLFSLGLLVGAAGYLTGGRHENERPWDLALQGFVGLGLLSLALGFALSVLG